MKLSKKITAGALALACVASSYAADTIRITGSTAFRKSTYNAIVNSLNNAKAAAIGGTSSDMTGDQQAVFTGNLKSTGAAVIIQTAFGGSTGGLQVITQGLTTIPGTTFDSAHTWMSASTNTLTSVTASGSGPIAGANILTATTANFDTAGTAQVTMADTFQAATPFTTPAVASEPTVGAVAYFWVKGLQATNVPAASYNALTNMTQQQGALLLSAGSLPLSVFTGNAADVGIDVDLIGRNNDSGTRTTVQAETSGGTNDNQTQSLYKSTNNGAASIASLVFAGDVGYDSGGKVASDLKATIGSILDPNGAPFILVGYVGKSDADTAVAGGAVKLTYNGVDGTNNNNIINGNYSYWNYEHIDAKAGLNAVQNQFVSDITTNITNVTAGLNGVVLSSMQVSRAFDGAPVSP
jgi:molybdate-binding protein